MEVKYDETLNSQVYTLLPITRSFVYGDVRKLDGFEDTVRRKMQLWLDADDIKDKTQRAIARGLRQGRVSTEETLLQLADQAKRRGDLIDAYRLYEEAIKRNSTGWSAHYKYAEFLRYNSDETTNAIEHYRLAALYAHPKNAEQKAMLHREFGIFVKRSGSPNGLQESIQALRIAVDLNPGDHIAVHALADSYCKIGDYYVAVRLLEPFYKKRINIKYVITTLIDCYRGLDDPIKARLLERELEDIERSSL